eukprot:gene62949-86099_t
MSGIVAKAQDITVNGKVTNSSTGKGIEGINVQVKGSTRGTVTKGGGDFSISVPGNGVLVFSGVGFGTQEIAVKGNTSLDVSLSETTSELNTVVVTALGITKQA